AAPPATALPAWLRAPAADEPLQPSVVRPSAGDETTTSLRPLGKGVEERRRAQQRGSLVHRLLQSLPEIASGRRQDVAQQYLARNASDWLPEQRDALLERTLALIENKAFAPLFGAGSRAEVPVVGRIGRRGQLPLLISGQIDRLVVGPS